jgi:hypothetical protein
MLGLQMLQLQTLDSNAWKATSAQDNPSAA